MKKYKVPIFYKLYLQEYKYSLILFAALLFFQSVLMILLPLPLKEVINNLDNKPYFLQLIGLIFSLSLLSLAFNFLENILFIKQKRNLQFIIRSYFLQKILAQPYEYHLKKKRMLLVNNLNKDSLHAEDLFTKITVAILRSVPSILFLLAGLVIIEPQMSLVIALGLPLYFYFSKVISQNLKKVEKKLLHREQLFEQTVFYTFESAPIAKSFAKLPSFKKILNDKLKEVREAFRERIIITARMEVAFRSVSVLIVPVVIFIGGLAIHYEKINLGDLFIIASYLGSLQRPVFQISRLFTKMPKGLGSLERLESLNKELEYAKPKILKIYPTVSKLDDKKTVFYLNDVSHTWPGSERPFIKVSDLEVCRGDFVAVVGASGTGKSSFLKFLNKLIEPQEGVLSLHDASIEKITKKEIRKKVRIILQDNFLLSASVRENITLLNSKDSDAKTWEALELVCAKDFVESLPEGLDTLIGRGGHPLSGGQVKRINLARAVFDLSDVSLIGLDEPTTGLDQATARKILLNFKKLSVGGRAVVWVTHNLNEVTEFKRVFLLKDRFLKDVTNEYRQDISL